MTPPISCKNCGSAAAEREYATPLCRTCRDMLSCRPLPVWMDGVIVLVVAAVAIGLIRFPAALKTGVAFERGQKAARRGDYAAAETAFRVVTARYPDFTGGVARQALAEYHAGHLKETMEDLDKLEGKEFKDKALYAEVDAMASELAARFQPKGESGGAGR